MSDSVRPHRRKPTSPFCSWDSPGKNTGVGCYFLLQCMHACMLSHFSRVRLCATLWTVAHQAPLCTEFSRQEYWRGLPFPSPKSIVTCCCSIIIHFICCFLYFSFIFHVQLENKVVVAKDLPQINNFYFLFPSFSFLLFSTEVDIRIGTESFPGDSVVKNLPANAGEASLIPGSGRFSGEGNGNPLQYSYLGSPMERGAWLATVHGVKKGLDMT